MPLSGGTDSRLIAAMLRDIGPRRLTAFTYGIKGSIEAETSRLVAAALDIPWQTVTLSPRRIHAAWSAEGTGSFLAYSHLGNALPHVQDWFAIRELSRAGVIGEDSVVLPGHTAARSYIPLPVGPDPGEVGSDKIIDAVILRHFNQRGHFPLATPYRDLFSDRIREELQLSDSAKDPLDAARLIQTFNIQHRQTKYILNSVRTYEHFGAGWSMPLLSAQCHRAMQDIDWSVQSTKEWYRRLTDSVVRRVAGATLDDLRLAAEHPDHLPVPAPGAVSSGVTAARRSFVRASRQLGNLRHPMAFEAFSRTPSAYLSGLARRQSPVGIFAHQFLQGTWNTSFSWRDPATWDAPRATRTVQIALPNPRE
ncbi:MAG: asparagine synthase-related protein [Brachybacterium sp.]|nr:asparagine synthase-related protein [Brachybacterium sp.]